VHSRETIRSRLFDTKYFSVKMEFYRYINLYYDCLYVNDSAFCTVISLHKFRDLMYLYVFFYSSILYAILIITIVFPYGRS